MRADVDKIQKVAVAFAALFGVGTYFSNIMLKNDAERNAASLAYVAEYSSEDLLRNRLEIANFWTKHPEAANVVRTAHLTRRERRNFFHYALQGYDRQPQFLSAVAVLQGFFDELHFCVTASLCDSKIIDTYFCDDIVDFTSRYLPLFDVVTGMSLTPKPGELGVDVTARCRPATNAG